MERKIYLCLLIFSFLSQVIATLSFGNVEAPGGLLVRKKRLIDRRQHGNKPVKLVKIPYIVNIHENGFSVCAGSILTPVLIITAGQCALNVNRERIVLSGSNLINVGYQHKIVRSLIHPSHRPDLYLCDLALLVIFPPIDVFNSLNQPIGLHYGAVRRNTRGVFSGWGCNLPTCVAESRPRELRSIIVPVMSQAECHKIYENIINITDKEICTFDWSKQRSGSFGDFGGPLVVNGRLAGVMSYSASLSKPKFPDVFTNLSHPLLRDWILFHMENY